MLKETAFLKNSEIFAEAMIRNGIRYHFAYPITPASDVMKYTAAHFPVVEGRMFQPESEIAVINAVAGCACAGELGVASTSGPGIDLMQETLSFMAAGELPCILLDNMRVGPGDGRYYRFARRLFSSNPWWWSRRLPHHCDGTSFRSRDR